MTNFTITFLLLLFVIINYKVIVFFKKKYYIAKENKYLMIIFLFMIILSVAPFLVVFELIPESLNNSFNGIVAMTTILFSWLLYPNEK